MGDTCIVGVSYADDGATLEESELGMNRVLAEFEKESRDIGNRYRQKDQRILAIQTEGQGLEDGEHQHRRNKTSDIPGAERSRLIRSRVPGHSLERPR